MDKRYPYYNAAWWAIVFQAGDRTTIASSGEFHCTYGTRKEAVAALRQMRKDYGRYEIEKYGYRIIRVVAMDIRAFRKAKAVNRGK